jgi:hypothetical protein
MDLHSGGERPTKRPSTGGSDEDRLTSLPDDLLRLILRGLPSTADAAQTSLLSRRWVCLWAGIPEIWFRGPVVPGRVHAALAAYAAHAGPPILALSIVTDAPVDEEAVGIIELPCLENATKIQMRLGCLGLAPPDSGVFARLETLLLNNVRFHGERELSEAVSSARCPSLRRLTVRGARGLRNLLIRSESLVALMLAHPRGLRRLMVVAPVLHVQLLFLRPQGKGEARCQNQCPKVGETQVGRPISAELHTEGTSPRTRHQLHCLRT